MAINGRTEAATRPFVFVLSCNNDLHYLSLFGFLQNSRNGVPANVEMFGNLLACEFAFIEQPRRFDHLVISYGPVHSPKSVQVQIGFDFVNGFLRNYQTEVRSIYTTTFLAARLARPRVWRAVAFDAKIDSGRGRSMALMHPAVNRRRINNGADNTGHTTSIVVGLAVDDVRLGRSSRNGFGCWLHPGRLPEFLSKITKKISKERSLMALPSLVTQEAAAVVTAPVSASPDVNHDFGSYDPNAEIFPEPWAAQQGDLVNGPDGTFSWRNGPDGFFE